MADSSRVLGSESYDRYGRTYVVKVVSRRWQLVGAVGDRALKSEVGECRHESVGVGQDTESELAACWRRYRGHLRSGVKIEPGAFHLHAVLLSDGVPRTTGR